MTFGQFVHEELALIFLSIIVGLAYALARWGMKPQGEE